MEHSGNIHIFNVPGTLFWEYSPEFRRELFPIFWEYVMGIIHEYSTNIYLPGGKFNSYL